MTKYQEILESADLSAYILNESTFHALSTRWTYSVYKGKDEWKMNAPELIEIAKSGPSVTNFNRFKNILKKEIKMIDSDGKEGLISFVELIELQNFKDEFSLYDGQGGVIDEFFKLFLQTLT